MSKKSSKLKVFIFFLSGLFVHRTVYSATLHQGWEHVQTYNDIDLDDHVLWTTTVKSQTLCGSLCTNQRQCLSFMWNGNTFNCKGFSKVYYSASALSLAGNRYFRRKHHCPSDYMLTPLLPVTPVCLKYVSVTQDFATSQSLCQLETFGTLLRIRNLETIEYIAAYLLNIHAPNDVFIAGMFDVADNNWKYSDGSLVTYLRWAPFEPNSLLSATPELCLTLQNEILYVPYFIKMNNKDCNLSLLYICQLDIYV